MLTSYMKNLAIYELIESYASTNHLSNEEVIHILEKCLKASWESVYGSGYDLFLKVNEDGVNLYRKVIVTEKINNIKTEIRGTNIGEMIEERLSIEALPRNIINHTLESIQFEIKKTNKETEYNLYKDQVGKLFTCTVKKVSGKTIILSLMNLYEGVIQFFSAVPRESFIPGDKVMCRLSEVKKGIDYQLFFERKSIEFVRELIREFVPDVASGAVEIKNIARDPGYISKVIVTSSESSINPVGACIGFKGQRRKHIIDGLKGEKVDFIAFHTNLYKQIEAFFPKLTLNKVLLSNDQNEIEIVVTEDLIPQIMGRRGQNVMLMSRLLNKKIKIISTTEYQIKRNEHMKQKIDLLVVDGFEEQEAHDIIYKYINPEDALKDDTISESFKTKIEHYVENKNAEDRERYVTMGGDPNFFLSIPDIPKFIYFKLLENNIQTMDHLKDYSSAKELADSSDIDNDIAILIMEYINYNT